MLHANELEVRPRIVRLWSEKKAHVFQRLAQAGGGDDFEIKIELRGAATVLALRGGVKLRHNARAERG